MSEPEISQTHEGPSAEVPGGASPPTPSPSPQPAPARPQIGDTRPAPAAPPAPVAPAGWRQPYRRWHPSSARRPSPPRPGPRRPVRPRPTTAADGSTSGDDDGAPEREAGAQSPPLGAGSKEQAGRPLPGLRARPAGHDPDRHAGRAAPWSSTTSPGPPTTPTRSTATSTAAGSRTCSRAWRPPSSTSGSRRTPSSTGATCATTATTSKAGAADPRRPSPGSRTCSRRARRSCAR